MHTFLNFRIDNGKAMRGQGNLTQLQEFTKMVHIFIYNQLSCLAEAQIYQKC